MRTDFLLDENDDLLIQDGSLVIGSSAEQECYLLAEFEPGELRQFPTAGFGIRKRLKKRAGGDAPLIENKPKFIRDLKVVLLADGQKNPEIEVTDTLTDFKIYVEE